MRNSEKTEEIQIDLALRDGLHSLPVPTVSADFDSRVLAALQQEQPWWQRLWQVGQPVVQGAAFSLVLTLVLVQWSSQLSVSPPQPQIGRAVSARSILIDHALFSRPNLRAETLVRLTHALSDDPLLPDEPPAPPADTENRRTPIHKASGRLIAVAASMTA